MLVLVFFNSVLLHHSTTNLNIIFLYCTSTSKKLPQIRYRMIPRNNVLPLESLFSLVGQFQSLQTVFKFDTLFNLSATACGYSGDILPRRVDTLTHLLETQFHDYYFFLIFNGAHQSTPTCLEKKGYVVDVVVVSMVPIVVEEYTIYQFIQLTASTYQSSLIRFSILMGCAISVL